MSKGSLILINGVRPNGRFRSGILSGVCYPGMQLQMKAGVEPINGCYTYEACSTAGANQVPLILLEDENQGVNFTTAYADGAFGRMYVPIPGDELNLLYANISGTSDAFTIAQKVCVNNAGKFVTTTGTPQKNHQCEETVAAITADTLVATLWN